LGRGGGGRAAVHGGREEVDDRGGDVRRHETAEVNAPSTEESSWTRIVLPITGASSSTRRRWVMCPGPGQVGGGNLHTGRQIRGGGVAGRGTYG
jgi:hypothetical protein